VPCVDSTKGPGVVAMAETEDPAARDRALILRALARLRRRIRYVRALTAATRFLTVALALAVPPLLLKGLLPGTGPAVALGVLVGLTGAGALYGLVAPLSIARTARLADQRLGLKERLTTALELHAKGPADDLGRAQLGETAACLQEIVPRCAFPFRPDAALRLAAPVAVLTLALALLPPVPFRSESPPDPAEAPEAPAAEASRSRPLEAKPSRPVLPAESRHKGSAHAVQPTPRSARGQEGDQRAVFRDTKMSQQRPDFGSFVKRGDDRLKLLAKPEALPDLNRDYTQSPYQVMIRQMQSQIRSKGMQGLSWEQVERLLEELGRAQERPGGGEPPDDLLQELQNQRGGSADKLLSALSRAMSRLRDREAGGRGQGKDLREAPGRQTAGGRGAGEEKGDGREGDGIGGSKPGSEPSLQTAGAPTPRLGGDKQDAQLEGELREGQTEAYDTNLSGRGAQNASRLPYMDVFSRYKKQMEEALIKEPIPFSYREQVREYFKALEVR
jgi:hypothetical protein